MSNTRKHAKKLGDQPNTDEQADPDFYELVKAIVAQDIDVVSRILLQKKDVTTKKGGRALITAVATLLEETGTTDVNFNALHFAYMVGNEEIITLLEKKHPELVAQNSGHHNEGRTPAEVGIGLPGNQARNMDAASSTARPKNSPSSSTHTMTHEKLIRGLNQPADISKSWHKIPQESETANLSDFEKNLIKEGFDKHVEAIKTLDEKESTSESIKSYISTRTQVRGIRLKDVLFELYENCKRNDGDTFLHYIILQISNKNKNAKLWLDYAVELINDPRVDLLAENSEGKTVKKYVKSDGMFDKEKDKAYGILMKNIIARLESDKINASKATGLVEIVSDSDETPIIGRDTDNDVKEKRKAEFGEYNISPHPKFLWPPEIKDTQEPWNNRLKMIEKSFGSIPKITHVKIQGDFNRYYPTFINNKPIRVDNADGSEARYLLDGQEKAANTFSIEEIERFYKENFANCDPLIAEYLFLAYNQYGIHSTSKTLLDSYFINVHKLIPPPHIDIRMDIVINSDKTVSLIERRIILYEDKSGKLDHKNYPVFAIVTTESLIQVIPDNNYQTKILRHDLIKDKIIVCSDLANRKYPFSPELTMEIEDRTGQAEAVIKELDSDIKYRSDPKRHPHPIFIYLQNQNADFEKISNVGNKFLKFFGINKTFEWQNKAKFLRQTTFQEIFKKVNELDMDENIKKELLLEVIAYAKKLPLFNEQRSNFLITESTTAVHMLEAFEKKITAELKLSSSSLTIGKNSRK